MARLHLLAWPAGHSLSPVMHNAALAALELPHTYSAIAVPPAGLADAVRSLRDPGVLGANVTVPHKEQILPLLDDVTDAVRHIGAVNTVVNRAGRLTGDNTDAAGFRALLRSAGFDLPARSGLRAVVLGAGGAARAALYVLGGSASVVIINRTVERAERLAGAFRGHATVTAVAARADAELLLDADLIVNTTSVGMEQAGVNPVESPLPDGIMPGGAVVVDMVYRPAVTRLMRQAAAAGLTAVNGLEMLVQQGAASLRLWTGREDVPVDVMRDAATRALEASVS